MISTTNIEYYLNTIDWTLPNEIWKGITNYEDIYQVSNFGRVRSLDRLNSIGSRVNGRILCQKKTVNGYLNVCLCKYSKRKYFMVHRLVAMAFIINPQKLPMINHKNEIRTDNNFQNLEWCTQHYNNSYGNHVANIQATTGWKKMIKNESRPVIAENEDGTVLVFDSILELRRHFEVKSNLTKKLQTGELFTSKHSNLLGWRIRYDVNQ